MGSNNPIVIHEAPTIWDGECGGHKYRYEYRGRWGVATSTGIWVPGDLLEVEWSTGFDSSPAMNNAWARAKAAGGLPKVEFRKTDHWPIEARCLWPMNGKMWGSWWAKGELLANGPITPGDAENATFRVLELLD